MMQALRQIEEAAGEWPEFIDEFSRAHHGWLVTVADIATEKMEQPPHQIEHDWNAISQQQPLRRVALEQRGETVELMIDVGEGDEAIAVLVSPVVNLYGLRFDDQHQGLRADTGNGKSTLIWFRCPALPETLDELAPEEL
jgi:hypothetical protein